MAKKFGNQWATDDHYGIALCTWCNKEVKRDKSGSFRKHSKQRRVICQGSWQHPHRQEKCKDCGLPYSRFALDTTLPHEQWAMIHPEGHEGLLCANCMVRRARKLPGIIAVRMVFDFGETHFAHKETS